MLRGTSSNTLTVDDRIGVGGLYGLVCVVDGVEWMEEGQEDTSTT
jgi:hypothetical protein